jgi:hypothetical protein
MPTTGEPIADWVAGAAARTVAAGSARLSAAWGDGSPVPGPQDVRGSGVADLAARRARLSQVLMPARVTGKFAGPDKEDAILGTLADPRETLYDGANTYIQVSGRWTGFFRTDPAGPRSINDPLWPLDAMAGASGDAVPVGPDTVQGAPVTHYRLTVDLARADAAIPAGVSVPTGPLRALSRLPAEVWLDAAGLIRRAAVISDPAAGDGAVTWAIVDLWDFGLTVDITPLRTEEIVAPGDASWVQSAPEA